MKYTLDFTTLTFAELLNCVGHTNNINRLPRATQIRRSNEKVLFVEKVFGATITIFKSGYIIYSRDKHETVTAVDRCVSPMYVFSASSEEVKEGIGVAGCKCCIIKKNNGATLLSTVPEETFLNCPWYTPIAIICEARLAHNQESREERRIKFRFNYDNLPDDYHLHSTNVKHKLNANSIDIHENRIQRMAFEAAKSKMTKKQLEAAMLYHAYFMTDKQVGQAMQKPCSQQTANKHRHAAYEKVKVEYLRIKKEAVK